MYLFKPLKALKWQIAIATPIIAMTTALHYRDPHVAGSWGQCPSAAVGIYCPGCGGLRAVHHLTNGDVGAAFSSNAAVVVLGALGTLWFTLWAYKSVRTGRNTFPNTPIWVLPAAIVSLIVFAVVRNFEFASYLQPSGVILG